MASTTQHPLRLVSIGFFLGVLCSFLMSCAWSGMSHPGGHWGALTRRAYDSSVAADAGGVLKFGNPGPVHDLLERQQYVASYDRRNRIAHWVGEHLTEESLKAGENVDRDKSSFKEDGSIPTMFRALLKDYTGSGYDRGHMAPAADALASQDAMDETFLLTNMAPQVGIGFNRHYWAYLEGFVRDLTKNYTDVYVYTGPLFIPKRISSDNEYFDIEQDDVSASSKPTYHIEYPLLGAVPNVAVPTHFYKIVLVSSTGSDYLLAAFVLPNQSIKSDTPLTDFEVELSSVERLSGLQFFENLDRQSLGKLCEQNSCRLR
ncbi:hypothetical protein BJV82DRAFT_609999 [Fennellomyces sp. T-0311]|nr:hypothetical protein BJV82DRAFT_609999 [Fennellomyces sp. T-0311]